MRWVVVDGLEKHWERARVTAAIEGDHTVKATTAGVTALTFRMDTGANLLNPACKATVVLDGQSLTVPGALYRWLMDRALPQNRFQMGSCG